MSTGPLGRRAALALATIAWSRVSAAIETWRMVTEYPATAIPGEGVAFFAEAVGRLSAGSLVVQPSFDGMRSAGMVRAVAENQVQAADAFTGALAGEAAIFQLSALPFLTASTADTARLLAAARAAYASTLSARGLSLLYATPWPASGIWSRQPLTGAEALAGLRIRTYDAASTAVLKAAGTVPEQISFADAMPRLRTGDLDAVLSSGDGGAGARLWELLPHFTVLDYASPLSLAFCNTKALEALPQPDRQTIEQAAKDTEARQFQAITTRAAENETRMRANGVTITQSPSLRAALIQSAEPVLAAWLTRSGPEGQAVLDAYRRR